MSGATYENYSHSFSSRNFDDLSSSDETKRKKAYTARSERIKKTRSSISEKTESELHEERTSKERDDSDLYDHSLVKNKITEPATNTQRIHIVIVDNSGSNRIIAEHFRKTSGYFTSVLNVIDPTSQIAFMYYSDHCDGDNINQEVDFISPNQQGDKILFSTLKHIKSVSGGDAPEAFECALHDACQIQFSNSEFQHLYLITDEVAHGMGEDGDRGCIYQRDWKQSVKNVYETYTSFEVIGCGNDKNVGRLQTQFIQKPERLTYDLIDLSSIYEDDHRRAIVSNALLFLIARKTGMQTLELFLSFLYEKWLEEHIFGKDSDNRAKEMIKRFGKFIEAPEEDIEKLMQKILN
jgi:hypothetical protein